MKLSQITKTATAAILLCLAGCASPQTPVTHLWKEIKGVGVPYQGVGEGQAILLSDLTSRGCVWLPAGTTVYGDKPWPRSPYSPIFSYRLPKTTTRWPCTAEAVNGDRIYFSQAVIPTRRIVCGGGDKINSDGKGVIGK